LFIFFLAPCSPFYTEPKFPKLREELLGVMGKKKVAASSSATASATVLKVADAA
jgi:hypothetical protein